MERITEEQIRNGSNYKQDEDEVNVNEGTCATSLCTTATYESGCNSRIGRPSHGDCDAIHGISYQGQARVDLTVMAIRKAKCQRPTK